MTNALLLTLLTALIVNVAIVMAVRVSVKGRLMCNGKPLDNTKLQLVDAKGDNQPDYAAIMSNDISDCEGYFRLIGTSEAPSIIPKLVISHQCKEEEKACKKTVALDIPSAFISEDSGDQPGGESYDFGSLNMINEFPGESRECDGT